MSVDNIGPYEAHSIGKARPEFFSTAIGAMHSALDSVHLLHADKLGESGST
jgi:hypothetical protein